MKFDPNDRDRFGRANVNVDVQTLFASMTEEYDTVVIDKSVTLLR